MKLVLSKFTWFIGQIDLLIDKFYGSNIDLCNYKYSVLNTQIQYDWD